MAEYKTCAKIGNVVDIVIHSKATPNDNARARREKRQHTTLAQQARNDKGSANRMAFVALGNFSQSDLYITATYDNEHLPPNRGAVKTDGARFVRRLRSTWADMAQPLKYIRVIEGLESGRYHHHLMINCPRGADIDALRALISRIWGAGTVQVDTIGGKDNRTAYDLIFYFYKEIKVFGRPAGSKAFSCSKNLDRGEEVTEVIPDNTPVDIPPNIPDENILIYDKRELVYSRYIHLRYIEPNKDEKRPASKRKRTVKPIAPTCAKGAGANNNITTKHTENTGREFSSQCGHGIIGAKKSEKRSGE